MGEGDHFHFHPHLTFPASSYGHLASRKAYEIFLFPKQKENSNKFPTKTIEILAHGVRDPSEEYPSANCSQALPPSEFGLDILMYPN